MMWCFNRAMHPGLANNGLCQRVPLFHSSTSPTFFLLLCFSQHNTSFIHYISCKLTEQNIKVLRQIRPPHQPFQPLPIIQPFLTCTGNLSLSLPHTISPLMMVSESSNIEFRSFHQRRAFLLQLYNGAVLFFKTDFLVKNRTPFYVVVVVVVVVFFLNNLVLLVIQLMDHLVAFES